jgi:hypothetical protein
MENKNYFSRLLDGHVLIVAFMVGLFAAVMTGLQQTLASAEASVKSSLSVLVFLQNPVSDADAAQLMQQIQSQDHEVQSVLFTSKDQAYQEALKNPNLAKSLMLLKSNPLPASLLIRYSDRAWWERSDPSEKIKTLGAIQEMRWDPQAASLFRTLHRWRLWCMRFSAFILAVLAVWAFIGLYRFLSLQSTWPDILSQLSIGLIGGALAWSLWGAGLHSIQVELSPLHPIWAWLLPIVLGAVAALGCFGVEIRHAE